MLSSYSSHRGMCVSSFGKSIFTSFSLPVLLSFPLECLLSSFLPSFALLPHLCWFCIPSFLLPFLIACLLFFLSLTLSLSFLSLSLFSVSLSLSFLSRLLSPAVSSSHSTEQPPPFPHKLQLTDSCQCWAQPGTKLNFLWIGLARWVQVASRYLTPVFDAGIISCSWSDSSGCRSACVNIRGGLLQSWFGSGILTPFNFHAICFRRQSCYAEEFICKVLESQVILGMNSGMTYSY